MVSNFDALPDTSRIWIYQSNRSFNTEELEEISKKLADFLAGWQAHGIGLKAGFEIKHKRFIVIGLDENEQSATGCSIDTSVRFIQELEVTYDVLLLDKMNVSYMQGEFVAYKSLLEFRAMAKQKAVSKNTLVFNNLVATKAEYLEHWKVPASESWHARFF